MHRSAHTGQSVMKPATAAVPSANNTDTTWATMDSGPPAGKRPRGPGGDITSLPDSCPDRRYRSELHAATTAPGPQAACGSEGGSPCRPERQATGRTVARTCAPRGLRLSAAPSANSAQEPRAAHGGRLRHVFQLLERQNLHGGCWPAWPSRPSSHRAGTDSARSSGPWSTRPVRRPTGRTDHRRRGLRRRLRGRFPGVGRLAARRRVRAGRGRRGVRRAPADRRGPPPPRRLRRRHPTHRGAADPHRPRRRGEHGPGGKLGGGGGARRWGRTGPLRPSDDEARPSSSRAASPSGCPTTATAGAGSRTRSTGPTSKRRVSSSRA